MMYVPKWYKFNSESLVIRTPEIFKHGDLTNKTENDSKPPALNTLSESGTCDLSRALLAMFLKYH